MNDATTGRHHALLLVIVFLILCLGVVAWFFLNFPVSGVPQQPAKSVASSGRSALARQVDAFIVAPSTIADVPPETARAINASVAFSTLPLTAAAPYRFEGTALDKERAKSCLAAVQLYEAGNDDEGQRAVAQVVLNRLRHPAYPKTICGVVFQGQERQTGCQFTFTCDGAMAHYPNAAAWVKAQALASRMLDGLTFKHVGYATHYHTDWVVPYWSRTLDKVAAVKTHLFFRWKGGWGRPRAFMWRGEQAEPVIPKLAHLSPVHASLNPTGFDTLAKDAEAASGMEEAKRTPSLARAETLPASVKIIAQLPRGNAFIVQFADSVAPESYAQLARQLCSEMVRCNLMAWASSQKVPTGFPLDSGALSTMLYNYVQDERNEDRGSFWNCRIAKPAQGSQCLGAAKTSPLPNLAAPPPQLLPADPKMNSPSEKLSN